MENIVTFANENQLLGLNTGIVTMDESKESKENIEEQLDQIEAQSPTPPPCRYTVDEMVQRVLQATADVDAGRNLISQEEFRKVVRSWYK